MGSNTTAPTSVAVSNHVDSSRSSYNKNVKISSFNDMQKNMPQLAVTSIQNPTPSTCIRTDIANVNNKDINSINSDIYTTNTPSPMVGQAPQLCPQRYIYCYPGEPLSLINSHIPIIPPSNPQNYAPLHPSMHPQQFNRPLPIYAGSHMYMPAPAYRSRIVTPANNGVIRQPYTPEPFNQQQMPRSISSNFNTPSQPHTTKNDAVNNEFANVMKKLLDSEASSKPVSVAPTSSSTNPKKETNNSLSISVENDKKPTLNNTSVEFKDLLKGVLESDKSTPRSSKSSKPAELIIDQNEDLVSKITSCTPDVTTPKSSVNEASVEFHNVIKNVAHADTTPIVTCEFGAEIDGIKVYTIDEMLSIRSKMTYDAHKMIQTISKFRIAVKNQSSTKSENVWRTMKEKKQLGLVSDKELFNHSLLQILNKITSVNFTQNLASFKSLKFSSPNHIKLYTELLFDKVICEHSWSYVYAELVGVSLKHFDEEYPNENYASLFSESLSEIIDKGLIRDTEEENAIAELKKFKSNDIDEIDRLIAETAERENDYRKKQFGIVLFISNLYYYDFIKQERMEKILKQLESYNDSLGVELYCSMLVNIAHKYLADKTLKEELISRIDKLNEIITQNPKSVTSKARFSIMDLVKYKNDKFKDLPPRKKVAAASETSLPNRNAISVTSMSTNVATNSHDSIKRSATVETISLSSSGRSSGNVKNYGLGRSRDTRHRFDTTDSRRANPDVFNSSGKFKTFAKTRGAGLASAFTSNNKRCVKQLNDFNVHLDQNISIPEGSSVTSRTNVNLKPVSLLKRPSDIESKNHSKSISIKSRILSKEDVVSNSVDTYKDQTAPGNSPATFTNRQESLQHNIKVENSMPFRSSSSRVLASHTAPSSSIEIDSSKDLVTKNLEENAENLISNFHIVETNVSRFIIELSSHSLSDHMDILLKEIFSYYYNVSHGHYALGVLLSEMIGRQPDLKLLIKPHLRSHLEMLSLDAIDEPVFWNYFFFMMLPILSNNRMTFDELHELLCNIPDINDPDTVIINMLKLGESMLAKYDVPKIIAKQSDTKFWKRITTTTSHFKDCVHIKNIVNKLPMISLSGNNNYIHWVDIFLDVSYDSSYIIQSFAQCYSNPDEGLRDLAKSLYLNANFGDKFTNDLINLFDKRSKEFMNNLFGEKASQKLLTYLIEVFRQFKYTPHGVIVDIGVPLYKNNHVDKEWLSLWLHSNNKHDDSSKIDSDIYKIINSL